jgi:hypothetical protein
MRPFPRRVLAVLAPVLFAAPLADAYPIAPVTLWQLTEQAELVVLARVVAVESPQQDHDERDFESDIARLQVLEVWKGSTGGDVAVSFARGLICPAPPRYVPGETVLAFLESGATRAASLRKDVKAEVRQDLTAKWTNRWFTVALSYGTLYPEADDLPFLHDLVDDALALQGRSPVPEGEKRAWHVRAATRRVTRWQGLYALDRETDKAHSFYGRAKRTRTNPTPDERREVMRGFILEPSDDHTLAMTLSFVGSQPEPEFDRVVLGQVERLLAEPKVPYWLGDAMARLAERFGSRNGRRELGLKDDWEAPNTAALQVAWQRTRDRYGIPLVPAAPAPPRERRGVGGSTPD